MSATEAARIAAVLPLPKERGAVAPKGFTRRYGNTIAARIPLVARDGPRRLRLQGRVGAGEEGAAAGHEEGAAAAGRGI